MSSTQDVSRDLGVKTVGRFIAVGGGRGGAGKSLVAVNLAVYFAQLGKPVVLVDADAAGANLHSHFGLRAASVEPDVDERSEEHTSELQSRPHLVCRLLLEKKKKKK